jgi:hypothetical protein
MKMKSKERNYRSKFEKTIGDYLGTRAEYEPEKLYFVQPAKQRFYLPDFKTAGGVFIECKGKWDASDRAKHVWLREQHPDKRIIIVFQNSKVRLNKRSKTTYAEWADKNNLEWLDWSIDGIPEELIDANKESNKNKRRRERSNLKPIGKTSRIFSGSRAKRVDAKRS